MSRTDGAVREYRLRIDESSGEDETKKIPRCEQGQTAQAAVDTVADKSIGSHRQTFCRGIERFATSKSNG
jgi:hypothetical protein